MSKTRRDGLLGDSPQVQGHADQGSKTRKLDSTPLWSKPRQQTREPWKTIIMFVSGRERGWVRWLLADWGIRMCEELMLEVSFDPKEIDESDLTHT